MRVLPAETRSGFLINLSVPPIRATLTQWCSPANFSWNRGTGWLGRSDYSILHVLFL